MHHLFTVTCDISLQFARMLHTDMDEQNEVDIVPAYVGANFLSHLRRIEGSRFGFDQQHVRGLFEDVLDDTLTKFIHDDPAVLRVRFRRHFDQSCQKASFYQYPYCVESPIVRSGLSALIQL